MITYFTSQQLFPIQHFYVIKKSRILLTSRLRFKYVLVNA